MTHDLGRVVQDGRTFNETNGVDLTPVSGPIGSPLFVILHFDSVNLKGAAKLTVELGYGTDVFSAGAGADLWSRPADVSKGPIKIRITGGKGTARLKEYGVGQPTRSSEIGGGAPGTTIGSQSNPDVFLSAAVYQDPIFETRLECTPGFAWRNAACALATIPDAVKDRVAAATGIIVEVDGNHCTSCSGTLIGADLFLTARHCLTDPNGEDLRSSSVTFDYATACDFSRPSGHQTRFFKVLEEVVSGAPPTGTENVPQNSDWVVVRLDAAPGALPAPAPLRAAALMTGETIFTMHHPNGAAKKTQQGTFGGGSVTGFDFAGGSSGSGLFDALGQVVGAALHSGSGCSVGYAPVAPVQSALAAPPPPPNPLDVAIVFDRSGSMSDAAPPIGRPKLKEAQDAAALFVQLVREGAGDRLGLVTFSSTAALDQGLLPAAAAKPALVGPAPFTGGKIGAIAAGGSTSIGAGVGAALLTYGASTNGRAILLMTDGLQNTPPFVEEIEPYMGGVTLGVVGFGTDADIDAPLLNRLAHAHNGHFTRATDGLALRKFFALSFGNIFESGALSDPDFILRASQDVSEPHLFDVCGEERITVVIGWDDPATPLRAHITTPGGTLIGGRTTPEVRGESWAFTRVPLPYLGERDGTWRVTVDRLPTGGEFPPPRTDVRYFYLVVCAGGPKLYPLLSTRRLYTGDRIDPRVGLHYPNRTTPRDAKVELFIEAPRVALGQLTTQEGLHPPTVSADPVNSFHATLKAVAKKNGGALPVATTTISTPLFDDGAHDDGALEPDGIFNNPLLDLTRAEGTYHFRAVASYGQGCRAAREAIWSIHVVCGVDPGRTGATLTGVVDLPDGRHGVLVITPRDVYGNPLGPGRGDGFTLSPMPGVTIGGAATDNGDGSYGVGVTWDPGVIEPPGVIIQQPGRDPAPITPSGGGAPPCDRDDECRDAASALLDCMGLHGRHARRVHVKSVCVEIDIDDPCCKEEDDGKTPRASPRGTGK
ncbi:trypsin-like peptidase domain-containing protein [Methylocystis sp. IM3]|uniref:trypsin-like peptidase domain-containing protein n=1 Tax=unclassified Methylocystis TaxID=2625913 RepID=UPI0031194FD6